MPPPPRPQVGRDPVAHYYKMRCKAVDCFLATLEGVTLPGSEEEPTAIQESGLVSPPVAVPTHARDEEPFLLPTPLPWMRGEGRGRLA